MNAKELANLQRLIRSADLAEGVRRSLIGQLADGLLFPSKKGRGAGIDWMVAASISKDGTHHHLVCNNGEWSQCDCEAPWGSCKHIKAQTEHIASDGDDNE